MPLASIPYVLLLGFLFGSTLIASRFSVGQYHPVNYVALRLILATLAHVLIYVASPKRKLPRDPRLWAQAALLGSVGVAVPMTSIVTSMQYQSSGLTSILLTIGPAITVVMAHFFLPEEQLTWRKAFGVTLAFGGAVLLAILGESGLPDVRSANLAGYALVFIAMLFGSGSAVYVRKYLRSYDTFDLASLRMFFAALTLTLLTFATVGFDLSGVDRLGYFALGYASLVGTFSGLLTAIYVTQRFGATPTAMTSYVIPLVAGIGGTLILGERFTPGMIAGMALILGGLAILNHRERPRLSAM